MEMTFSVSRLKSFKSCPYRAAWKYVLGNTEPETEPTVFGKAVHEVLRLVCEFYSETRVMPKPRSKELTGWIKEQEEKATGTGLLAASAVKEIGKLARRGVPRLEAVPAGARMLVEHHFTVAVPGRDGKYFQGFIDLGYITADGEEAVIEDWKTNRKSYEVAEDPAHQLPLYAWAIMQQFPTVKRVKLRLNFLRLEQWSEVEYDAAMGEAAVEYLQAEVDRILAMYKANAFPATPGSVCDGCQAALMCPAANSPVSSEIWSREDAEGLLGHMLAVESKLAILKAQVRGYVEHNGPIEKSGEWAALYAKPVLTFTDKATVMEVLRAMGLNALDFLQLDQTALRRMAESDPQIEAVGEYKPGTPRFDHRSSPPDEGEVASIPEMAPAEAPAEAVVTAEAVTEPVPAA